MFRKHYLVSKLVLVSTLVITTVSVSHHASAGWLDKIKEFVGNDVSAEQVESAVTQTTARVSSLSAEEISAAFKQALDIGSRKVVDQLSAKGGFANDAAIRIPLPEKMQTVKKWLDKVGVGDRMDGLELKLNRAAEDATPKAKALFVNAIKTMSFDDARKIYNGGDNAATHYFREKMTPELTKELQPIVQQSISEVGAVTLYDDLISDYKSIPFVPDVKADLVTHVIEGGLKGIFYYLAKEEAAIRQDPVKRTTELLERVFGAK
ncbi:MAG: hypothetical protein ACI8VC_002785 [Candidatus Endobugula sp.]|jgi:hypothetical protein